MINNNYCLYLRKSRADAEAESRGEGETLARHERILLDLAQKQGLSIGKIYKEVVSGESIQDRPVMQELLSDISNNLWTGCLVVEVERLARGDTQDQGIVAKAFKYSNTLIITPTKTYDPNNEFDEEYFEFGLFMSRREYKVIKRRMQQGRQQSAKEGKWVGNIAPYGYNRVPLENDKGFTLSPHPEEAPIYDILIKGAAFGINGNRLGDTANARRLNGMGFTSRNGNPWTASAVCAVRQNISQTGKIVWGKRKHVKKIVDGKVTNTRPRNNHCDIHQGLHPALVDDDTWKKAQEPFQALHSPILTKGHTIQSSLSGLVVCSECGRKMVRRPYKDQPSKATLICSYSSCPTVSSNQALVEDMILSTIKLWVRDYELKEVDLNNSENDESNLIELQRTTLSKELESLTKQHNKLFELLETGIYDSATFLERSEFIKKKKEKVQQKLDDLELNLTKISNQKAHSVFFIPICKKLIENYHTLDVLNKNKMLKELIEKVEYSKLIKNKKWEGHIPTFELEIFPRVPKN